MTEQLTGAELKDSRHSSSVMLSHPADRLHINYPQNRNNALQGIGV